MEKVNIFDAIGANKRNSYILLFLMCSLCFLSVVALGYIFGLDEYGYAIALIFAVGYALIAFGAGSRIILSISGARELLEGEEPFLRNVVEGLAMAAGIPCPKIWIIEDGAMNAFATGTSPENSHIVFTRGLLKNMSREQLEGVAAHEISHIGNYDIRMATLAVVMVGLIAIIGEFAWRSMMFRGNDNRKGGGGLMLIALVFVILAPIFAELVRFAISRQREYLADATGAKLTRYPEGLASALEKLKGHANVKSATNTTASLFIANPFEGKMTGLLATHPPLDERVNRLRAM
ncbi:M48 family metallopeptidase [Candidatus Micrarchaeota archaeon]|nr:M48 family metallopeptidase [Candidatus Micrarchaeota archaeon]